MTRDEMIILLQERLGARADLNAAIILETVYTQSFLLEGTGAFIPWFLESVMSTVGTTVAATETIALPTDFLGEIEDQHAWYYDAANTDNPYQELPKGAYDNLLQKYPITGIPKAYSIIGDYMAIHPVPDAAYIIKWRYYARATSLTTNVENSWLKHAADLVLAEVGYIMADKYLQNSNLATRFQTDIVTARQRLYVKHEARRHANRLYGMGED